MSTSYKKRLHDLKIAVHRYVSEYDGEVELCEDGRNAFLESLGLPPMGLGEYILRIRPTTGFAKDEIESLTPGISYWCSIDDGVTDLVSVEEAPNTVKVPKPAGPVTKADYDAWVRDLYQQVDARKDDIGAEIEDRTDLITEFFETLGLDAPKASFKITVTFDAEEVPGGWDMADALNDNSFLGIGPVNRDTVNVSYVRQ